MSLNLSRIPWKKSKCWCYNPRNGKATFYQVITYSGSQKFDPTGNPEQNNDWILVIDDASRGYTEPGK